MSEPRVLVLMAVFEGAKFIRAQMDSILAQQGVNVSVLVSVDSSRDSSEEILAEYEARLDSVTVIHRRTGPAGAAANFFSLMQASQPSADYVALADQDDVWLLNKLETACDELSRSRSSAYSSNVYVWDGSIPFERNMPTLKKGSMQRRWDHLFSSAGPGCTYVFRADAFSDFAQFLRDHDDALGRIDYHDWLAYAWFRTENLDWMIDSRPTMYYRQHAQNQIGSNRGARAKLKRLGQVKAGWYGSQILATSSLLGQSDQPPIRALVGTRVGDRARLFAMSRQIRRRWNEGISVAALLAFAKRPTGRA